MIALLLAAASLCAGVTDVAHSAPAAFERVRGARKIDEAKSVVWTDPAKVPGADRCRVIGYKDGSPPFYVCEMQSSSCADGEKKFEAASRELPSCIGEARTSDDGKKRTARFSWHHIPIRLTFARGGSCELRLFIEPLK